jgi:hypothetical protein
MSALPLELQAAIEAALRFRAERGMGPGRIQVEIHDNGEGVARRWVITHQEVGQPRKAERRTA